MDFSINKTKNTTKRWKFWVLYAATPLLIVACTLLAIVIFLVKDRIPGQEGLEKGLIYAKLHRHTEALEEFKKELIKNPEDANIHYHMGISYFRLKKYEHAESELKFALNNKPDFTDASLQLGVIYLTTAIELRKLGKDEALVLDKLSLAEETCKTLIRTNPALSQPYSLLAKIHLELGFHDLAVKDFQDALKIDDLNIDTHIALARLYVQNGNFDLAEIQCKRALSHTDIEHIEIQLLLSRIYEYQDRFVAAIDCLKQIVEQKPDYLDAHIQLSVLFLKTAQYDSALIEAEHSIKLSSSDNIPPIIYFVKGYVFLKKKNYREAIALLQESALKLPTLPETHYYLALALAEKGRYEEAKTAFKSSVTNDSKYLPAQIGLARLFAREGSNNETLKIGKQILEMYPDNVDAMQIIGSTYIKMHDYKSAEKYFRKIVELNPSLGDINLAYLTLSTGELDKCIKQCEAIIKKDPNTAKAYDILGMAHIRKGEIEKGAMQFKKVIELDKYSVNAYINLAKVCILNEDNPEAIKTLETLHSINQDNLEARMLLADLYAYKDDSDKTETILKETIESDPNYLPAYKLASLYLLQGETKKSLNLFNKAINLDPANALLHAYFAVAYQQENKGTSSILYGKKSLDLNGDIPDLKIIMTNLYASSGKKIKAENLIESSVSLTSDVKKEYLDFIELCQQNIENGKQVTLALNKAIIAKQEGFLHHSVAECRKAATLLPDNLIPKLILASIYISSNQKEEAIKVYTDIINQRPEFISSYNGLGEAYILADRQHEAISIFKDIISRDDNSVHARLNLATLLLKQGFSEKAKNIIEKAVEIDPENPVAHNLLGTVSLAYEKFKMNKNEFPETSQSNNGSFAQMLNNARVLFEQGDLDKCIGYCKMELEENPSNTQLRNILGLAFLKKGLLRKAETEFNKIIAVNADFIPAYLALAEVTLKRNQTNIANILYQTVLNINPNTLEAHIGLGNSYYLMGNHQAAIEEFNNILKTHPDNVETYIALTKSYLAVKKFELAGDMIKKALYLEPRNLLALSLLARTYLLNENIPEALNQLKVALHNNKYFIEAYNLGVLHIHNGNYRESIALYKQAVEYFPDNAQFWCNLAIAHLLLGEYENARNACSQALTIEPNSIISNVCMVNIFLSRSEHESAGVCLQDIPKLNNSLKSSFLDLIELCKHNMELEKSVVYHLGRAIAFTNIQWLSPALGEYQELAKIIPSNTIAYDAQADILFEMGENVQAIKTCNKILELNPQSTDTYNKLADIYYRNGQTEEAVIQYKKVVEMNPLHVSSYLNLGVLQELRSSLTDAVNAYKKVIELNPSSPVAYNNLAWLYATKMQNKLDDALILAKKAKTLAPENAEIIDTLGWLYYLNGEYEKAVTELKIAVKVAPWNPIIRFHLGTLFYKKGLHQMALTEMERVLKMGRTLPESEKAKLIIEEIKLSQSNNKKGTQAL
ncbi:MAG: tetratricopeptide repeat protein [Candidatus Scalindua sp.]|nr:tetratricopeptide repeat protein [Candidatus Scalindua sp.]